MTFWLDTEISMSYVLDAGGTIGLSSDKLFKPMADENQKSSRFQVGDLILDTGAHTLTRSGDEIQLPRLSFALFATLVRHAPKLMKQDELLTEVWGEVVVSDEALKQRVMRLRQAIGDVSDAPHYIASVRGLGYRLIVPVKVLSEEGPLDDGGTHEIAPFFSRITFITKLQRRIGQQTILLSVLLLIFTTVGLFYLIYPRTVTQIAEEPRVGIPEIPSNSIAVLPFENISGEEANEPFAIGIHDDLLTYISKIESIKTISRTSVLQYRDTLKSVPQIAEELGVATVLEGGVQRSGDRVRINVQLVAAERDEHIWAETYDRELSTQNIFAIQSDVAKAIANALQVTLSAQDKASLTRRPTESLEAYQAYLLGRQRMVSRAGASLAEAAGYFQRAVELDPEYALAYVGLADTRMLLGDYGAWSLDEMLSKAEPALDKALALNDQLAEAYASMGAIKTKTGEYAEAEAAHLRAIELDPNYATTYHWYGDLLITYLHRFEEAVPLLERAREIDPLSPSINVTLGEAYAGLGRFDEAKRLYLKTIEIEPAYPSSYGKTGDLYRYVYGRLDEAVRWRQRAAAKDPGSLVSLTTLGRIYLDLGDDAQAEYWIDRAASLEPEHSRPIRALMALHRYRGEQTEALQAARRLLAVSPGDNAALETFVSYGLYEEAIRLFAPSYPDLSCDGEPVVSRFSFRPAINLSLARQETGDRDCASILLDKALELTQTMPRLGFWGYGIADVELYARQGETRQALAALRRAIDEGWRTSWWSHGEQGPHTVSLQDDPEFKAMMEEVKADLATQLTRVREMDSRGDLAAAIDQ